MADERNALTTSTTTDLARAQEIVNKHAPTDAGHGAGGDSGAGPGAQSQEAAALDARIDAILALAHTGRMADGEAYARRQGELADLIARKSGLQRGGVRAGADLAAYPELPDIGRHPPSVYAQDAEVWAKQLPKLKAAGITPSQAGDLARILREAEVDGENLRVEQAHRVRQEASRQLAERYGDGYLNEVRKANDLAKALLPNGAARQLVQSQMADGSLLGDNSLFVRMMIEFAREQGL